MDICEILIIEDDKLTIESWRRDIREFNRDPKNTLEFNVTFVADKQNALSLLSRTHFDCAVVDLRLPDGDISLGTEKPLGNHVLSKLLEDIGIPTVVYSAYEGEASDEIKSSNIKIHTKKGGETQKILNSFLAQSGLMCAMRATRSRISKATALLFNQSIWQRWEKRWALELDKEMITEVIARQTASHVYDTLSQVSSYHHPDEFYVVPALYVNRIDTGDLLLLEDKVYVVLTPRCNMANKPPTHLTLAICSEMPEWAQWKEQLINGNAKAREKTGKDLRSHATQGHGIATHFLPPLDEKGPWLVDFQEIRTVQSSDIPEMFPKRFASIAPHFTPNLVQRYSSYLGRIGQPDIDTDILRTLCTR